MSELLRSTAETFRFNSEFVSIGLKDLDPEDAVRRWKNGEGSSIAYLTGHISSSRYGILRTLGVETDNPYKDVYGAGAGSKEGSAYPSLPEIQTGWLETAAKLHAALDALSDEDVLGPPDSSFPTSDQTLRGQLAFIAWHENYHIGQIGIFRTEMGYPSLRQSLINARQSAD